jgi:hypothetical protein
MTSVPPIPQWAPPPSSPVPSIPPPGAVSRPGRRGRALFWIALALMVAGMVLLVAGVGGVVSEVSLPDSYPVVDVPGTRQVHLSAGATYTLYVEVPADAGGATTPEVVVTAPSGDVEPLVEPVVPDETYDRGRYRGRAFAGLAPVESGTYRITTSTPAGGADNGERVAVGESTFGTSSMVGVGLMALGVLALLGGIGVGIGWLVRRAGGRPVTPDPVTP